MIGLVTVLFNSDDVLEGFIKSLSAQTFKDYYLILIDNTPSATTDALIKALSEKYGVNNYVHIKNAQNVGIAKGNNQGISLSLKKGTTHTLLLNNDIEFDDTYFLKKLWLAADTGHENLVIPKILYYGTQKIWMAGGDFVLHKGIIKHYGDGKDVSEGFDTEAYVNYAPTCVMLINNKLFDELGLMDERYFVYYDDTDFLYRAYIRGYRIKYLPQAMVLHKVSWSTGGQESPFTIYYSNRNRIYFINKNLKGLTYLCAISFTMFTRIFKYIKYNDVQREQLMKAVKDAWAMQV